MKGLNTVQQFAKSFKDISICSEAHKNLVNTTVNNLRKLKTSEMVALANQIGLNTQTINGKTLSYTKDRWIDLLLEYSHLA